MTDAKKMALLACKALEDKKFVIINEILGKIILKLNNVKMKRMNQKFE